MNRENEREVFDRASASLARINRLERLGLVDADDVRSIKTDLEMIRRRSDPARFPDYDPEVGLRP